MPADKYSVLLIGLDGATFDLMLPWINEGRLPALASLVQGGSWSRLRSTIPPHTPCAWSSLITGMNPGKHGVFDFVEPSPGSYSFRFANGSARHAESLWSILSRQHRRVGVLNCPMTYPPEAVNGYMVSGLDAPHERSRYMFPDSLRAELQMQGIDYRIDLQHMGDMRNAGRRDGRLRELQGIASSRTQAFEYLSQAYPSDFRMLVYTATDRVQHHFWHFMDKNHDKHDPEGAARHGNAIRDMYVHLDGLIAPILEGLDENTVVMLMSDHGFGPTSSTRVRVNQGLAHAGLLRFAGEGRAGRCKRLVARLLDRVLRTTCSSSVKRALASCLPRLRMWFEELDEAGIDWARTVAHTNEFYRACPSIWMNREDHWPLGIVKSGEDYETAVRAVIRAIQGITDHETGRRVVSEVIRASDVYHGPYVDRAPDLMPSWWEDGFLLEQSSPDGSAHDVAFRSSGRVWGGVEFTGSHRIDGVFAMAGGPVKRGHAFAGADITDIAPTVLYLMGLPIPGEMDGRPLLEGLEAEFVKARPPGFEKGPSDSERDRDDSPGQREEVDEAQLVESRLRALGYLD